MRTSTLFLSASLALGLPLAALGAPQASDTAPVGPLTTNNGSPACVQFGSCSTVSDAAVATQTYPTPVSSPASSVNVAQPTDAVQSQNAASALAASGAAAAFSGGAASPARSSSSSGSARLTGTVLALPSSSARASSSASSGSVGAQSANAAAVGAVADATAARWMPVAFVASALLVGAAAVL